MIAAERQDRIGPEPSRHEVRVGDRDAGALRDQVEILVEGLSNRRIKGEGFRGARRGRGHLGHDRGRDEHERNEDDASADESHRSSR